MNDFEGKTAFVTGGASGIGLALARAFARRGARIMLADIDAGGLGAAADMLRGAGAVVDTVQCDVASEAAMRAAADATLARFGKVHILANNAGVGLGGQPGEIALADWNWVVGINLMGVVHGVEIFTPLIRAHGEGGYVLNTASMAGHTAMPGLGPYNATKFAVVGYSESLAAELAPDRIGVGILCPGWVQTNIHNSRYAAPTGTGQREGDPDDPHYQAMKTVIEGGLRADVVAQYAVESLLAGRLYIFTHTDMRENVDARARAIAADYDAIKDDARFSATSES